MGECHWVPMAWILLRRNLPRQAQLRRDFSGPPSPWATAAAATRRPSQPSAPILPEARKLLERARALMGDGHLRRADFEVAEHSALTLTTVSAAGEVDVDGACPLARRARLFISRGRAAGACAVSLVRGHSAHTDPRADEKLKALRKIVYSGMDRKLKAASEMQAS